MFNSKTQKLKIKILEGMQIFFQKNYRKKCVPAENSKSGSFLANSVGARRNLILKSDLYFDRGSSDGSLPDQSVGHFGVTVFCFGEPCLTNSELKIDQPKPIAPQTIRKQIPAHLVPVKILSFPFRIVRDYVWSLCQKYQWSLWRMQF